MRYKLTVWNGIIIILIPVIAYILIRKTEEPNTVLAAAFMIPILIIGAVIDLVLQVFIKNRKYLAAIEIISLIAIIIISNIS